jgi:hypothetical protein
MKQIELNRIEKRYHSSFMKVSFDFLNIFSYLLVNSAGPTWMDMAFLVTGFIREEMKILEDSANQGNDNHFENIQADHQFKMRYQ